MIIRQPNKFNSQYNKCLQNNHQNNHKFNLKKTILKINYLLFSLFFLKKLSLLYCNLAKKCVTPTPTCNLI